MNPWMPVVSKTAAALAAIVVLAWIGKNATAGAPPSVDADAGLALTFAGEGDAGIAPAAPPIELDASSAPATPAPATTQARASAEEPVYLNLADEAELRRLPGVGAKRAEAILALRQKLGRFTRVEDLLRVKGIGRKTLKKWRPMVRLEAARAPPA